MDREDSEALKYLGSDHTEWGGHFGLSESRAVWPETTYM